MDTDSPNNYPTLGRPSPNPASPRLNLVIARRDELLHAANELGAIGIALCGSVARGEDSDKSDIDFYVTHFEGFEDRNHSNMKGWLRATQLVKEFRRILEPYHVDVRPLPGWCLGADHETSMRRDAIDLEKL